MTQVDFMTAFLFANGSFMLFNVFLMLESIARERRFKRLERSLRANYKREIERGEKKAAAIIEKAYEEYKGTLLSASVNKKEIEKELNIAVRNMAIKNEESAKEFLSRFEERYAKAFVRLSKKLDKRVEKVMEESAVAGSKAIAEFVSSLKEKNLKQRSYFEDRMEEEVKKAVEEVERYKKDRMEGIEREMNKIIAKVSEEVLGEAINPAKHEELVFRSLEKAKKEQIFKI